MTRPSRANRRDANEPEIVEFWRACGCLWIPMQPGQGFDGLLISSNGIHMVEIKNGQTNWKVTREENDLWGRMVDLHQDYSIIENLDQAIRLIGR